MINDRDHPIVIAIAIAIALWQAGPMELESQPSQVFGETLADGTYRSTFQYNGQDYSSEAEALRAQVTDLG